ncbi:L-lactate dehydrogenase [Serinicoccus hydrothermalis]|uniref:L-lactate dehydrogenase n=1 Tax=Serinicoccus hydrothermalis TaxID=1758689 RepID=A0A1B1N8I6_9MICO|nr:alpha-hydroxy acid oxidase [Serinicoccus hydrothermalis]ANS77728.1 L-lactate dehydrogenase [Serinicoccus hydrothermalis]
MSATYRYDEALARAREVLPAPVLEYLLTGAGDGRAAAEAAEAWAGVRLRPRVLHDVTTVDLRTRALGEELALPFAVAPTTLQRAVHPEGEVAMARACAAAGQLLVVSSNAGSTLADIGATGVRWWVQAYLTQDRDLSLPLLERAVEAGAGAVVLTVDTPVVSTKRYAGASVWEATDPALLRVNFPPDGQRTPGAEKATDLSPEDLGWLREATGLPVVVKGVLRGDEAVRSRDAGADAVWVSNHGGRQLDRVVPTATALPEVRAAVGPGTEVYVDGGVRTGLDVLVALACGADLVLAGRAPVLGLVDGEDGVRSWQQTWTAELVEAMRLAGVAAVADLPGADLLAPG